MLAKHILEVNESEIILQPAKHVYTLVWLHGMGEEPQHALSFLLRAEILKVLDR